MDVSLREGKKSGGRRGFKTAKSIPRDESNVNLSGYFRSRCQTVKKNGGGMSNEFSRILVTRFRERNAYDLFPFPNFSNGGGNKITYSIPYLLSIPNFLFLILDKIVRNKICYF